MADTVDIKIIGMEKLQANIERYQKTKAEQIRDECKKTGFRIESAAKKKCPVDSGRLRGSVTTNWTGSGKSRGSVSGKAKSEDGVGNPGGSDNDFRVVTGTNVNYAPFVEHGTRRMRPKPYLYPAYHSEVGKLKPKLTAILKQVVK